MTTVPRLRLFLFLSASLLVLPTWHPQGAAAQAADGFALNRFEPAERGSDWFSAESLDLRGHVRPAIGLTVDWAHKPLVLYDENGDEQQAIIRNQVFGHLGASLTLWSRLRVGFNLPVQAFQSGGSGQNGGIAIASSGDAAVGDLRLGGDVRLLGEYGDAFNLALGLQVHLPSGDRGAFAGDGAVRLTPRALVAGDIGPFAYSARLSFAYRAQDDKLGFVPLGNEVSYGAAAGLRLVNGKLLLGPEVFGSTVVQNKDAFFAKETSPFELLFGGHYRFGDFRVGAGMGPGLTRGLGAPKVRVVGSLEWHPDVVPPPAPVPAPPPSDRDGDGIVDDSDACPDEPGIASDDPLTNGCTPPADTDGDGIADQDDACVNVPGVESTDPEQNGCPEDGDHDGIVDAQDACPLVPGVANEDPKKHGCPPPGDRDKDGIKDDVDACPAVSGPENEDPKKHGCPVARVEADQIKITERVEFKTNSAKLAPSSTPVLEAVLQVLKENEDIEQLRVEGHTDDRGKAKYNKRLSQRRADSVVQWLVQHGIERKRLTSKGRGLERPIASNETPEGRQENRRVEFHIERMGGQSMEEVE